MGWFAKNMGDALLAEGELEQLKACFHTIAAQASDATAMALFIRHEAEGRLHCEVKVYFSPAAHEVARAAGARPSARPSPRDLGLLAGDDACWPLLFPEQPVR